jgi:hypothetical protein
MVLELDREKSWKLLCHVSPRWRGIFAALLGFGALVFFLALKLDPLRGWQAYLINFLFWGGVAQGAVVFAAIYHVVGGKWGPSVRRCGEGMVAFLPVNLALFLPLYFTLDRFLSPARELNPARGAWFDPRFIFVRGVLGLGLMTVLSLFFVYYAVRPEVGWAHELKRGPRRWIYEWITDGWEGEEIENQRCRRGMDIMAAGVLIAYPMTYTFMAFDLIMALDPIWYSSLFGGYFFISTFYLGLAAVTLVCVLIQRQLGPAVVTSSQLSDLGRLLLGFDLTYLAMIWSQYIVIWYGNLPEETQFIILRVWKMPWAIFSWSILALSVFLPFLIFLSRQAKQVPKAMFAVAVAIGCGMWLERYILIVPSLWRSDSFPLGWIELGVTVGFLGACGLSYSFFLARFPVIPFVAQAERPAALEIEKAEENPSKA